MRRSLGVYVHIPFCNGKCAYCDFVSGSYNEDIKKRYFESLVKEISEFDFSDYLIDTLYFGGGTPSSVDAKYITDILRTLRKNAQFSDTPEITLEGNPESLTAENLRTYANSGINRLSIGLQSASDSLLFTIGRRHTVADFINALNAAQENFDNISADIMLGLPGQTEQDVIDTVNLLTSNKLTHISAYSLKVEEGTPLEKSGYVPDEDFSATLYELTWRMLKDKGYDRYEVSNFALKGRESRHNIKYWRRAEYKGFGIAAHSFIKNVRTENTCSFDYLDGRKEIETRYIDPKSREAAEEMIMLALRTSEGLDICEYNKMFADYELCLEKICDLSEFVTLSSGKLMLTDKGFYVMNEIIIKLLS